MPSRLWRAAAILAPSLLLASLAAAGPATAATTSNPSLITSDYACTNGVCEVGPGSVGVAFGSELNATGGTATVLTTDCNYTFSVVSGSLPPGLQLGGTCGSIISGTPTQAGTYPFTVQVTNGGTSTQPLTITIGTGKSDRLLALSASYNAHTHRLLVDFYDANVGPLYSVSVTATGKQVIAPQSLTVAPEVLGSTGTDPTCTGCTLTVSNSLGSSATVPLAYKY